MVLPVLSVFYRRVRRGNPVERLNYCRLLELKIAIFIRKIRIIRRKVDVFRRTIAMFPRIVGLLRRLKAFDLVQSPRLSVLLSREIYAKYNKLQFVDNPQHHSS
jgi:hypothetical protein